VHNSTTYLQYEYCTNSSVCNGSVLTVITHKLLLHVQLHNSTAHLLYKYCTNFALCNWLVLTVIPLNIMPDAQLHNNIQTVRLTFSGSAVLPGLWYCTCINTHTLSHVVRTDLSNSRYSPKAQCHHFTAIQKNSIPSPKATASVLCSVASEWNNIENRDVNRSRVRRNVIYFPRNTAGPLQVILPDNSALLYSTFQNVLRDYNNLF